MADPGYLARVVIWRADVARWESEALAAVPTKIEMEDLLDWLEAGRRSEEGAAQHGEASDTVSL